MQDKRARTIRTIGKAIAKYRQSIGMTQAELAEILDIGNDAVSRMEQGTTVPTVLRLIELSEIFKCELADLLTESSNRSVDQARKLDSLLHELSDEKREELVDLMERMVAWQR